MDKIDKITGVMEQDLVELGTPEVTKLQRPWEQGLGELGTSQLTKLSKLQG